MTKFAVVSLIVYNARKVKKLFIDYTLNTKVYEQAFYRLIVILQKKQKIDILSVPFINLNFPPSSGAIKGSHKS